MTSFEALIVDNVDLSIQGVRVLERVDAEPHAHNHPELRLSGSGAQMGKLIDRLGALCYRQEQRECVR